MSTVEPPLSELAGENEVDNVLLFVSDSTRYDRLPDRVAERGVTARTIAPSTWTAASLPSITSGRYPTTHQVWRFDTRLPRTPRLLADPERVGFDAETIWTHVESAEKPPLWINRLTDETALADLEPPFVHVVHDKGGHAPYGHSFDEWDSSIDYFDEYADRPDEIVAHYEESVASSADRFLALVDQLEDRGILDDTLAIFASDHGELLGEPARGGIYGHGAPVVPELVRVPTTFVGAGLPEGERYGPVLSGVDLAPTALGAYGLDADSGFDGVDAWNETPPADRLVRSELWTQYTFDFADGIADGTTPLYAATSLWNGSGGAVFHHNSAAVRTAYAFAGYLYFEGTAAATRAGMGLGTPLALLRTFAPKTVTYGRVSDRMLAARSDLPSEFAHPPARDEPAAAEGSLDKEQLRKLGYIE